MKWRELVTHYSILITISFLNTTSDVEWITNEYNSVSLKKFIIKPIKSANQKFYDRINELVSKNKN